MLQKPRKRYHACVKYHFPTANDLPSESALKLAYIYRRVIQEIRAQQMVVLTLMFNVRVFYYLYRGYTINAAIAEALPQVYEDGYGYFGYDKTTVRGGQYTLP